MGKLFKTIKIHKCSVNNCTNLVKHEDSFCNDCLDKLSNNYYVIKFCFFCRKYLGIVYTDRPGKCIHELAAYGCCDDCSERMIDLEDDFDWDDF